MTDPKFEIYPLRLMRSLAVVLLAAACSSLPPIATNVDYANDFGAASIKTYRVEFGVMPDFLKPMLRDEASLVLASKGLEYSEGDAHAILLMSFFPRPLATQDAERDDFSGALSSGGDTRFIAEIHVDMKNSVTSELIWSGLLSRYHNVTIGSYMHDAPARTAMRQAFMDIFADYPNPALEQK